MSEPLRFNEDLGTILDDAIKQAFSFPFYGEETCQPDPSKHVVHNRTFYLNNHLVVLKEIRLFPGLTFHALEANTGELNVFTQEGKFEIDIPTVGGYYYAVSEDKNVKPVHQIGIFKINYGTAIAEGITSFFVNEEASGVSNMAMNFKLVGKPNVTFYYEEADALVDPFRSDIAANSAKVAEVLWPSVHALIWWILRDKLWDMSSKIPWNDDVGIEYFETQETRKRDAVVELLDGIMENVRIELSGRTNGGRLQMPNLDLMIAPPEDPETWGRFKATSGWLENVTTINVSEPTVHVRNHNELVIVAHVKFDDWKYRYEEYTIETNNGNSSGEIVQTLDDSEAFITITATRNGPVIVKVPKFQYTNATNTNTDILGADDFQWLKIYVEYWMSGLMDAGKPTLHELIDECLKKALADVDLFVFWDELNNISAPGNFVPPPIGFILQ